MLLAIESSCDESALALFDKHQGLCGEWVHSQIDLHKIYGGVVPDLASREHFSRFPAMLSLVHEKLEGDWSRLDGLAVTHGPGLAACLAMGMAVAESLAVAWKLPLYGINHLRGHAYSPFIALHREKSDAFFDAMETMLPHLGLIVSGGNTVLFMLNERWEISVLAQTVDDAAGEALDKGAKLLGLPYPGGPQVEKIARAGKIDSFDFPRAFPSRSDWKFSFSGLKTSLRYQLESMDDGTVAREMSNLCASYQEAVMDQIARKVSQVLEARQFKSLGLSGGVANNTVLRERMDSVAKRGRLPFFCALPEHRGDNAGMIAFAAFIENRHVIANGACMYNKGIFPSLSLLKA